MNERLRQTVICRVRVREDLKPVKTYYHSGPLDPDWMVITHVTGQKGFESFDLQFLKRMAPACANRGCEPRRSRVVLISWMSYETLRIAMAQARADIGVEYVEWEPCHVEITNEEGSIDWEKALPIAEPAGAVGSE